MMNRLCQLLIVLAVFYALSYKTVLYWSAQTRPWQPVSAWGRVIFYYSFFTVLANLLLAISSLVLLFKPHYDSRLFRIIRLDALVGIIITMIVYNGVLRSIHHPPTFELCMTNELLHLVVPIIGILSWLVWGALPSD
ncbi:Pr6Pr family membrane protein [Utexia brackfieldae]|uniref:Pr6Pr family membrane protein n=1 Tax=Utexia brackfieldae TaxID=3074108 RepID=UPI00370D8024